uniref:Uncharacterized protein n=1 Tax=Brassica oleracea TaxID=3712 RepID=A0A3P6GFP2_BRAOL|nr:unnamed protein product [Brassica oleracea]
MRRNDQKSCICQRIGSSYVMHDYLTGDSLQIIVWLIIAEIMA